MKRILLCAVLCLASVLAWGQSVISSGTCGAEGDNLTWELTDDGTLTISGTGKMEDYSLLSYSPWGKDIQVAIIEEGVTSIGEFAFDGCTALTSVTIPEGVTSIGEYAFDGCRGLTSVTIPEGVTSIKYYAFRGCTSLTSVTIPGSVTSIEGSAFSGCTALTFVTIPGSVIDIGSSAFDGCTALTSVTMQEGVTSIEYNAFDGCTALTSVTIPGSVTSIGSWAFENCTSLTSVYYTGDIHSWCNIELSRSDSSPLCYGADLYIQGELLTDLNIPEGITSIRDYAFRGCTSLTSVTIPEGVTSIGAAAFSNCTGLTSVTIPGSVTSIGGSAFYNCTSLTSVTIPGSVTSIGGSAFYNCTSLTSVTIPGSVTSIEERAFEDCTSLTSVTIQEGVTSIGRAAFTGCTSLTSVTMPGSVTSIEEYAFDDCTNLETILLLGNDWPELEYFWIFSDVQRVVYTNISTDPSDRWDDFKIVRLQEVIEMLPCEPTVYSGKKPNLPLTHSIPGYRVAAYGDSIHVGEYEQTEVELCFTIEGCQDSVAGTFTLPNPPYTYTIQKKSLVATTEEPSYSIHYGDDLPIVKLAYQGLVPGDDETAIATPPAVTCESGDRPHVGTHQLTLSGGEARDYEFVYEPGTLTVEKAPLTVTSNSHTRIYGDNLPQFKIVYEGFVYDEDETALTTRPTVTYEGGDRPHAGIYTLTLSGGEAQDYEFVYEPGTLTVEKAWLTVTADTYTNQYGEGVDSNRLSYKGFVYDEDATALAIPPVVTCDGGDQPHVGTHALTPSGGEAQDYEFAYEPGTLTVEKAPLTASPKPCTMAYGDYLPWFEIAYEGFVYDDDESVLTAKPRATTDATRQSDTGTYPIRLSGGDAHDYVLSLRSGTLTIEQAEQEIWWPQDFSAGMLVGEEMELYATATCGEDVLFSSSNGRVVSIERSGGVIKLTCLSEGQATITANQYGNKNYKPAPAVRKTIIVTEDGMGTGFSSTSVNGLAIYPNPATTHVNIQAEGGIKRVLLHSLAGTLLMDEDGHGEATHRLDLTRLPQGTYLLTVETSAGVRTERIVKE